MNFDPLLMLESTQSNGIVNWAAVLELAMDLGMVNSAEKIAGELMEIMGPYPEIIYRRALIQIAGDNRDAAAIYLKKLSSMPFYRQESKWLLNNLNNKKILLSKPRLAAMHAYRDTIDYYLFNNVPHDVILKNLLQSNSINKMAYDYLVTYYLLTGRLDDVVYFLQFASLFGIHNYSRNLRECQRDLTSFSEKVLINTQNYEVKCVNCHTPMGNDPNRFTLQVRSDAYGSETLIANGDSITTLSSQLGHTSWHPSGRYIAFAAYKVQQYFHAVGRQFIDVYDNNSGIIIYDVANQKILPVSKLNQPDILQTWPAWSADGCYLYYCCALVPWKDYNKEPPDNFNKTRYSLMRIAYDTTWNCWGNVDTVLSSIETGQSIAQPKLSPDNRFCLFCMQEFGAYPHTEISSDLYLMDIATRQYHKLPINSDYNEGWHSWSKNSRWILFSSKRGGGIFTRLYISHIDSTGRAGKPFILPQRDPLFYDSFIQCYNVAEFAVAPVRFSERQLLKVIQTKNTIPVPVPKNTLIY